MKVLGLIRLAPGQVGFYDELTRIHLTIANPERRIIAGMNTTNIKKAVRSGRLLLVSGSLDLEEVEVKAEVSPSAKEAEIKLKQEAEAKLKAEAEAKEKAEKEAKAKAEAEEKAKKEKEEKAEKEAAKKEKASKESEKKEEAKKEAPKKKATSKKTATKKEAEDKK